MARRRPELLIVESDPDLREMIEGYLSVALPVRISSVSTMAEALREELTHRHDAVLASLELEDGSALHLAREIRGRNRCPVLLMAEQPDPEALVTALRLGVRDVLLKPVTMAEMAERLQAALRAEAKRRGRRRRVRRLRLLSMRMIRERRDLRQRTDLICRDLVQAYRALAHKVTDSGFLAER
jgi:DNA-binding response OmpR family regulator